MIHRVAAHAYAFGNEDVLRAAIGCVAREFTERALRLVNAGKDFPLDEDFGGGRYVKFVDPTAGEAVGFTEQTTDDLELPHIGRIGVDHRAHIMQRMGADCDHRRQRVAALLGAAMKLVHAPA